MKNIFESAKSFIKPTIVAGMAILSGEKAINAEQANHNSVNGVKTENVTDKGFKPLILESEPYKVDPKIIAQTERVSQEMIKGADAAMRADLNEEAQKLERAKIESEPYQVKPVILESESHKVNLERINTERVDKELFEKGDAMIHAEISATLIKEEEARKIEEARKAIEKMSNNQFTLK